MRRNSIYAGFLVGLISCFTIDNGEHHKPFFFNIVTFKFNGKKYHMHHWFNFLILFLILALIVFNFGYNSIILFIMGLCLGCTLQGLSYGDAFHFRVKG